MACAGPPSAQPRRAPRRSPTPCRRPEPFGAWAALLLSAVLGVLALGHWLRVGGAPVTDLGPLPAGRLVEALPLARSLSHWYRAAGPATVFLAAAAGLGAGALLARLPERWTGAAAVGLAGLVLTEGIVLSPVPWPRVHHVPDPPAALLALPKPGALLQIPFDEGRGLTGIASRRVYDQWQVFHRRGISEHCEGRDFVLYGNALVAGFQKACVGVAPRPRTAGTPADDLAVLADQGFAYLVVHPEFAKSGCLPAVTKALGAPTIRSARAVAWDVAEARARLRTEGG